MKRKATLETDFRLDDAPRASGRWLPAIIVRCSDHPVRLRVFASRAMGAVTHAVSVDCEALDATARGLARLRRIERAPDAIADQAPAIVAHYVEQLQALGYRVDVADVLRTAETLGYALEQQRARCAA